MGYLTGLNLNDKILIKAISCLVIPVAGYVKNVCNLGEGDLDELDMTVKIVLRSEDFMEDNQAMRNYIKKETKVVEDWIISKRFTMKEKLEWYAVWLHQQTNG